MIAPGTVAESPFVDPALAGFLVAMHPAELAHLLEGTGPPTNEPPVIRSATLAGRTLVYLPDVLVMAGALADSGLLHEPEATEPPF